MAKYYVSFNELQVQAEGLISISKTLAAFEDRLVSIANAMDTRDSGLAALRTQLSGYAKAVPTVINRITRTKEALVSIYEEYLGAEKRVYEGFAANSAEISKPVPQREQEILEYLRNPANIMVFNNLNYIYEFLKGRNAIQDGLLIGMNNPLNILGKVNYDSRFLMFGIPDPTYLYRVLNSTDVYRKSIIKDSVCDLLQGLADQKKPHKTSTELSTAIKAFKLALKSGGEVPEQFKGFYDGLKAMSSIIKWGDFSFELLDYILTDYSENLAYLEAIETPLLASGFSDSEVLEVFSELRRDYTNKFIGSIEKITEKVQTEVINTAISTALPLYKIVDFARELTMQVDNNGVMVSNIEKLAASANYSNSLVQSYDEYLLKIVNGTYTADDLQGFEKTFEVCKAAKLNEYNLMLKISNDQNEIAFLKHEIEKIEEMSISPQSHGGGGGSF